MLIEIFCFILCLSLLSDGVCLLELKGLLTYLLTCMNCLRGTTHCSCARVHLYHITLPVLYFDQETNACLKAIQRSKSLDYYATDGYW